HRAVVSGTPPGSSLLRGAAPPVALAGIRIRYAQPPQYSGFQPLHRNSFAFDFVVVAEQMQKAVYYQMDNVVRERDLLLARLGCHGLLREHDIAEERPIFLAGRRRGEGENVGRPVLAAVAPIEGADP